MPSFFSAVYIAQRTVIHYVERTRTVHLEARMSTSLNRSTSLNFSQVFLFSFFRSQQTHPKQHRIVSHQGPQMLHTLAPLVSSSTQALTTHHSPLTLQEPEPYHTNPPNPLPLHLHLHLHLPVPVLTSQATSHKPTDHPIASIHPAQHSTRKLLQPLSIHPPTPSHSQKKRAISACSLQAGLNLSFRKPRFSSPSSAACSGLEMRIRLPSGWRNRVKAEEMLC